MSQALDKSFEATLRKSPNRGGWTYVVMPDSAAFLALGDGPQAARQIGSPKTHRQAGRRYRDHSLAGTNRRTRCNSRLNASSQRTRIGSQISQVPLRSRSGTRFRSTNETESGETCSTTVTRDALAMVRLVETLEGLARVAP